jgi:hypothetical protein
MSILKTAGNYYISITINATYTSKMPQVSDSGTKIRGRKQSKQPSKPSDGPPPTRRARSTSSTSSKNDSNAEGKKNNQRLDAIKGKEKGKEVERDRTDSSLDREYEARPPRVKTVKGNSMTPQEMTPQQRARYKQELERIRMQSSTSDSSSLSGAEFSDVGHPQESLVENTKARIKLERGKSSRTQRKREETMAALHLPESSSKGELGAKILDKLAAQESAMQKRDEELLRKRAKQEQEEFQQARQVSADLKTEEEKKKLRAGALGVLGQKRRKKPE